MEKTVIFTLRLAETIRNQLMREAQRPTGSSERCPGIGCLSRGDRERKELDTTEHACKGVREILWYVCWGCGCLCLCVRGIVCVLCVLKKCMDFVVRYLISPTWLLYWTVEIKGIAVLFVNVFSN